MTPPSPAERRFSLLQIHAAVLLAGATGLFAKFFTLNPATIIVARTVFGALTLAAIVLATRATLRLRSRKDLFTLALTGAILAAHWFTFIYAIQISTVAIGVLAFSSFPLFVTFLEPLVFRETLHRRDIVAACFVVAGLVLVTPKFDFQNHLTQGLLWGIVSGLAYAFVSLLSRSSVRLHPPLTVAFYQQTFAALAALPIAGLYPSPVSSRDYLLLAILGVVFTGIAQWLLVASLRRLSAQTISICLGLEPVYAILLAWLLLGEVPGLRTLLGGLVICSTVLAVSRTKSD